MLVHRPHKFEFLQIMVFPSLRRSLTSSKEDPSLREGHLHQVQIHQEDPHLQFNNQLSRFESLKIMEFNINNPIISLAHNTTY